MTYKKTNEALRDEHATIGGIDGKKTFIFDNAGNQITNFGGSASATVAIGSSATIFAVVNTAAAGQASVVLDTGSRFIGLATVNIGSSNATLFAVVNTAAAGQSSVVLDTGVSYIGLATVDIGTNNAVAIRGNVTLSDSKGYIGLVTVTQASAARTITGNVTIQDGGGSITIDGNVGILGNVTLSDSKTFIGLTTTTLGASPAFIGIATVVQSSIARTIAGNVTLSDAKTFIGLTTAIAINAGTNKTLIHKTIALTQASIATIAVPSNTFKITRVLLNSDATVRVNIKSGATYLTGNATVGITLNPGGGWVENGSPDSPVYIGLAGAAAIVLEKFDMTATSAKIGGKFIYFDE